MQFLINKDVWTKVKVRISYNNRRKHRLGLRILDCQGSFKHYIGQTLFENNSNWCPKTLYHLQFPVESIKTAVNFKIVKTKQEYDAVITLRNKAYAQSGKVDQNSSLVDHLDERSIIIVAKHGPKVVASLRLIISESHQQFEHEQFLILPKYLPPKKDMMEITRVCTHPDYRAGDLLEGLFQYSALVSVNEDRNWILGSSTDSLLPLYLKLGFQRTPISFEHQDLSGLKHTLFYANKNDILLGPFHSPRLQWLMP